MIKLRIKYLLVLLTCLSMMGCQSPPLPITEEANPIILELNGRAYSYEQFRFFVSRRYPEGAHIEKDDVQSAYLDAFVRELYLYEMALEKGFRASEHQIDSFIRDQLTSMSFHLLTPQEQILWRGAITRRLSIRELMVHETLKRSIVADEQVLAYYEEHAETYNQDSRYRLRFFRTNEEDTAKAFHKALSSSRESFATIADQQEGHDGSHRLTLELTKEGLLSEFYKSLRRMKPGQFSKVIPIKQGEAQSFYVLYLEAVLPPRQISYDEAQHEIRTMLQQQSAQAFIDEQLQTYREKLPLKQHHERLPFNYLDPTSRSES